MKTRSSTSNNRVPVSYSENINDQLRARGAHTFGSYERRLARLQRFADVAERKEASQTLCQFATGTTALMIACVTGNIHAVRVFCDGGADLNATDSNGTTALMMASAAGHLDIVLELCSRPGIDVNMRDNDDRSALMFACGVAR
jgi:ankyrin repeat protein